MNMHPQGGVASRGQWPNAGVDVCKQHLDVCLGTTDQRAVNDPNGWNELIATFKAASVDLVVVEATGGYERGLVCALQAAGITVARVNPRQARDFAKSMGVLAKTDKVDARTLRDFADVLARHKDRAKYITPMLDEHRQQLAELMTRRRQLVDMRVAEGNHLEHATAKQSVRSIKSVLKTLDKQLEAIDREIRDFYAKNYPDIAGAKADAIDRSIQELVVIYTSNVFPQMKVTWGTYPDNSGHFDSPGCWRCHDRKHKTDDGKKITRDCGVCHTILAQEEQNPEILETLNP